MGKKKTINDVIKILNEKDLKLLELNYESIHSKIKCIDSKGYKYEVTVANLRTWSTRKFHVSNSYTLDNIMLSLKDMNSKYRLKEGQKYLGSGHKLIFLCPVCGEFEIRWNCIMRVKI